jgi:hypothetical protein
LNAWHEKSETVDCAYNQMNECIDKGFKGLCGDIAEGIEEYFMQTHAHGRKPRVGIHMVSDDDTVVDVVVIPAGAHRSAKALSEYSAFDTIVKNGLPYLCNNIPVEAKRREAYKHAGLDIPKIKNQYLPKWYDKKLIARLRNNFRKKNDLDVEWRNMSSNPEHITEDLYKSHLVVPITYRAHADKQRLDRDLVEKLQLPENGRSILGFICIDHPATHYFDSGAVDSEENIDINVVYVFADMLSLVIMNMMMFTNGSSEFKEYEEHKQFQEESSHE